MDVLEFGDGRAQVLAQIRSRAHRLMLGCRPLMLMSVVLKSRALIQNLDPERPCTRMSESHSGIVQRSSLSLSLSLCQFRAAPTCAESLSLALRCRRLLDISVSVPLRSSFLNSGCSSRGRDGVNERMHAHAYGIIHWVVGCKVIIQRGCRRLLVSAHLVGYLCISALPFLSASPQLRCPSGCGIYIIILTPVYMCVCHACCSLLWCEVRCVVRAAFVAPCFMFSASLPNERRYPGVFPPSLVMEVN